MKAVKNTGFTIIEIMLFLGISGLLISGIFIGVGTSINVQRYRDSVSSLQSNLQNRYSEVSNVVNTKVSSICAGVSISRGQSNCVVLGKYITSYNNGSIIRAWNVIGDDVAGGALSDDVTVLSTYNIRVTSPTEYEDYDIEWGSSLDFASGTPIKFSMLILRSPSSGVVRTFLNNTTEISTANIVPSLLSVPASLTNSVQLCVDSNGLVSGKKMAISINAGATGESSIETLTDSNTCL